MCSACLPLKALVPSTRTVAVFAVTCHTALRSLAEAYFSKSSHTSAPAGHGAPASEGGVVTALASPIASPIALEFESSPASCCGGPVSAASPPDDMPATFPDVRAGAAPL